MILPACVGFLIHHKQANQLGWGFLRVFMYRQSTYEHAVLRQTKIITDPCCMLHTQHQLLPSGRKFRVPRCQFNSIKYKKITLLKKKNTSKNTVFWATLKLPSASAKQLLLTQAFTSATQYANDSKRWKEITSAIAYYVTEDMAPIATVDHSGFTLLVKTLDKR